VMTLLEDELRRRSSDAGGSFGTNDRAVSLGGSLKKPWEPKLAD